MRTCCPVVDCVWEEWSGWSSCGVTCGVGTQVREREQIPAENGGFECEGDSQETRDCNTEGCPGINYLMNTHIITFI